MRTSKSKFIETLKLRKCYTKYVMFDEDNCPLLITPTFIIRSIPDNEESVELVCWDIIDRLFIATVSQDFIRSDFTSDNGVIYNEPISYHNVDINNASKLANIFSLFYLRNVPKSITINARTANSPKYSGSIENILGIKIK